MNILVAIESFYDGGAEMVAIRLANGLAKKGNKVFFVELCSDLSLQKHHLKLLLPEIKLWQPENNVLVRLLESLTFPQRGLNRFKAGLRNRVKRALIRLKLASNHIEIVSSHYIHTDEYFGLVKGDRCKVVATFHGHYELFFEQKKTEEYRRRLCASIDRLDHIVYLNSKHIDILKVIGAKYQHKITKILHGFEMPAQEEVSPTLEEGMVVTIVSRCIKEKGWRELIQAVVRVNAEGCSRLVLNLVGDGDYREQLQNEFQANKDIRFHGQLSQEDIYEVIKRSHVTALPSYYVAESMPNSIIEYLSFGKPVIATSIGAIGEMIETPDGQRAGILVEVSQGAFLVDQLVAALKTYLSDSDKIVSDSKLAFEARKKFDIDKCVSSYLEVFEKLAKSKC